MGIKALRKKYGIDLKRGDHVEYYTWSRANKGSQVLMRDFHGNITSVKDEEIHCKGHIWWAKGTLKFELNKTPNVVMRCKTTGNITYDSREGTPPEEEE